MGALKDTISDFLRESKPMARIEQLEGVVKPPSGQPAAFSQAPPVPSPKEDAELKSSQIKLINFMKSQCYDFLLHSKPMEVGRGVPARNEQRQQFEELEWLLLPGETKEEVAANPYFLDDDVDQLSHKLVHSWSEARAGKRTELPD